MQAQHDFGGAILAQPVKAGQQFPAKARRLFIHDQQIGGVFLDRGADQTGPQGGDLVDIKAKRLRHIAAVGQLRHAG